MKTQRGATNVQPENSRLIYSLNLLKNKRAFWGLQVAGTFLLVLFGIPLCLWTVLVRAGDPAGFEDRLISLGGTSSLIGGVLAIFGSIFVALVLHELVHGLFFWIFTRQRPIFGFRSGYAYAGMPGWFFPRRQYIAVGLAPFVLLTVLGMILLAVVPAGAIAAVLFGTLANAAGAVGDLWVVFLILRERRPIAIEDLGDGFNFYALP